MVHRRTFFLPKMTILCAREKRYANQSLPCDPSAAGILYEKSVLSSDTGKRGLKNNFTSSLGTPCTSLDYYFLPCVLSSTSFSVSVNNEDGSIPPSTGSEALKLNLTYFTAAVTS